jgi:hypothetical protein
MSDYGDIDRWTSEQVAARRQALAELAETADAEDLPKLAHLHDLLDVLDAVNQGTVTSEDATEQMRAEHHKAMPGSRITWHAADPSQAGRGWAVHPADVTDRHLNEVAPMIGPSLGMVAAMCDRVWVQTTGDPDVSMADESKTAITFGSTSIGQVYFGMTSAQECDDDTEAIAVAGVALALPVSAARAVRDDLNRAIQRADILRRKHIDRAKRLLCEHLLAEGVDEDHAAWIADAAEAAFETGIPQVVIGPDGVATSVSVADDGTLDYGWEQDG